MRFTILLFSFLLLPALSFAQCDCPPIEMEFSFDCDQFYAPWDEQVNFDMTISFHGGCAGEDGGEFSIDHYPNIGDVLNIAEGEQFVHPYSNWGLRDFIVFDTNWECVDTLTLPYLDAQYFSGSSFDCPDYRFYDCEKGILPGVPTDVEAIFPEGIGLADSVQYFTAEWIDQYGCTKYQNGIAVCNITNCDEISLQWVASEFSIDTIAGTETSKFMLNGTTSAVLGFEPSGFKCWLPDQYPHTIMLNGDTIYSDFSVSSYYYEFDPFEVTYPLGEPYTLTVVDQLTGCVYDLEMNSCDCDEYGFHAEQICNEEDGTVTGIYVFNEHCAQGQFGLSYEVSYNGDTFIVADTLMLNHQPGEIVSFPEIKYLQGQQVFCTRTYESEPIACPPVSNRNLASAQQLLVHVLAGRLMVSYLSQDKFRSLEIYDCQGRLMLQQSMLEPQQQVNVSHWPTGSYFVRVYSDLAHRTTQVFVP